MTVARHFQCFVFFLCIHLTLFFTITSHSDSLSIMHRNLFFSLAMEEEAKVNINLSSDRISPPKLLIKLLNNSLVHSTNSTEMNTYYFSFSSELTCRFSFLQNLTICFYYPSSTNFLQIEHYFDELTNGSLILPVQARQHFIVLFIVMGVLIFIVSLFAFYVLCTNRLSFSHMIQLDYIIDPQLAREAALKLSPEPV